MHVQLALCVYTNGFLLNITLLHEPCCPAMCTDGCHNGGTCVDPEMCECPSNWEGQNCEVGESLFAQMNTNVYVHIQG